MGPMVVADPAAELLDLVRRQGDPPPAEASLADQRAATLIRRRFALALPPPFAGAPAAEEPIRPAVGVDGAAIAAVRWRVFATSYRGGVLPDAFLDGRDVIPAASFWTKRAVAPPSGRHRLLVWGRPGTVFGYLDCGPASAGDGEEPKGPQVGEVYELYVDPAYQGAGGGTGLLGSAEQWLTDAAFEVLELTTLVTDAHADRFYRARGWEPAGDVARVERGTVSFDEARYRRVRAGGRS
jgi:GNAT superfamily N-acetyltransferase